MRVTVSHTVITPPKGGTRVFNRIIVGCDEERDDRRNSKNSENSENREVKAGATNVATNLEEETLESPPSSP